jgi:AcrR family transcriptional regulator
MATDVTTGTAAASLAVQLRTRRSQMMVTELESVALRLFRERRVNGVTVEDIASEAHISARTFYRYFATKEDVLQVQIDRRADAVRTALAARPLVEAPLHSVRVALTEAVGSEDLTRTRLWTEVVATNPEVVKSVLGGILVKTQQAIAEFFASRLDTSSDALVPTVLAAATLGVVQAAHTQWYVNGGDLVTRISDGIGVLEQGIGSDPSRWHQHKRTTKRSNKRKTKPEG